MGAFSDIDVALQEKASGRGDDRPCIGSIGVRLDDTGRPPAMYRIDSITPTGNLTIVRLDNDWVYMVSPNEFWVLI